MAFELAGPFPKPASFPQSLTSNLPARQKRGIAFHKAGRNRPVASAPEAFWSALALSEVMRSRRSRRTRLWLWSRVLDPVLGCPFWRVRGWVCKLATLVRKVRVVSKASQGNLRPTRVEQAAVNRVCGGWCQVSPLEGRHRWRKLEKGTKLLQASTDSTHVAKC